MDAVEITEKRRNNKSDMFSAALSMCQWITSLHLSKEVYICSTDKLRKKSG